MENINLKEMTGKLIKDYIKARTEGIITRVSDKASSVVSAMLAGLLLFLCLCCTVFFASFTAAFSFSNYLGKPYVGFLVVCGFYLLLGIIVWWQKDRLIKRPIMKVLMGVMKEKIQ
jgi:hypothetical protein